MDIWLSTSDILDNLDPEQNSVVSQVIQVVGLLGNSMSPLVIVDNLDPETSKPEHFGGDDPATCVGENSGENRCEGEAVSPTDSNEEVVPENTSKEPRNPNPGDPTGNAEEEKQVEKEEDEEEGTNDRPVESHEPEANSSQIDIVGPHTSSLLPPPLVTDKLTQSETSEPATELEDKATDATSPSTEEEGEEAGTATGFNDRETFLTSLGNDESNNEQSESFLSRENSATFPTEPGTEPQPQTHAWTFDPESQAESSFPPTETPTPEAELLSSSGSEAQAPETPPKQETPAEPSELEIPPDCPLSPALETESVETIQQLAQPAEPEVETSPELEITQLETQPVLEIPPEQDKKPASAVKPEGVPETQTVPETNVEQEQDSAPRKEVTSMQETKETTEKLTGQSEMGVGLESRDRGSAQSTSSALPEDDIMEEEEEGALGELQEDGFHNSQCSESSGEMTPCDEKNRSKVSKYKTVSYRKIRKGNTKQRIDEFESMINT